MDTVVIFPCGLSSRLIIIRSTVKNIRAFYFSGLSQSIRTYAHPAILIHQIDPSKLVRYFFRDGGWLIFHCARPTRAFWGCALREHRRSSGC